MSGAQVLDGSVGFPHVSAVAATVATPVAQTAKPGWYLDRCARTDASFYRALQSTYHPLANGPRHVQTLHDFLEAPRWALMPKKMLTVGAVCCAGIITLPFAGVASLFCCAGLAIVGVAAGVALRKKLITKQCLMDRLATDVTQLVQGRLHDREFATYFVSSWLPGAIAADQGNLADRKSTQTRLQAEATNKLGDEKISQHAALGLRYRTQHANATEKLVTIAATQEKLGALQAEITRIGEAPNPLPRDSHNAILALVTLPTFHDAESAMASAAQILNMRG